MTNLDYKVIASGSTGNAVRIEHLMIDCGIPYKDMQEELYKVDTLFITHVHGDHLKDATIRKIMRMFPNIKIYGNYEVAYRYPTITPVGDDYTFKSKDLTMTTFECVHDVKTQGLLIEKDDLNIIYATDTAELPQLGKKFDYLFIESNFDEEKLAQANEVKRGYNPYLNSASRHLSTQKSKLFYVLNRKNTDSKWIELHKSRRFY